jgi:hypothetical protein
VLVYVPAIACSLLGWVPIESSTVGYLTHMLPIVLATELWLLAMNYPYNDRRRRQRRPYLELWRVRTMWAGLAPVFMKAALLAVVNGPNCKPSYKVTRKHNDLRWHWRETLPQSTAVLGFIIVLVFALRFGTFPTATLLIRSLYWGGLHVVLLGNFVTRGWHGLAAPSRWRRHRPFAAPAGAVAAEGRS